MAQHCIIADQIRKHNVQNGGLPKISKSTVEFWMVSFWG